MKEDDIMQNEYITFSAFPSVVPADKESEISVRACGGNVLLYATFHMIYR